MTKAYRLDHVWSSRTGRMTTRRVRTDLQPKNHSGFKTLNKIAADPRVEEIWEEGSDGIWVSLVEGWNLIGIPFIPTDAAIETMLSGVLSYVSSVKTYDGTTGGWYTYSPGRPSNLQTIEDGKGYWILMTADAVWEIDIG